MLTNEERLRNMCYNVMFDRDLDYGRRKRMTNENGLKQPCPTCGRAAGTMCVSMTDVNRGSFPPKTNTRVHDTRVDWLTVLEQLIMASKVKPKPVESPTEDMPDWARG